MEGWEKYIDELEENSMVEQMLIVKLTGDRIAKSSSWMYDEGEMINLEGLVEELEKDVPIRVQDGEYLVVSNDGTIVIGETIGKSEVSPRVLVVGKTRTYLIVAVADAETDDGKALKEVQWIIDHIASEGY